MAISILQHTQNSATFVTTFAGACTVGSTIVLVARTGANPTACSDPTNGAYANRINQTQTTDGHFLSVWDFQNNSGNTALTVTLTAGAASVRIALLEIGGVSAASLNGTPASTQTDGTTAPATPSLTTTAANAIVLACCSAAGNPTYTENAAGSNPASGWAVVEDVSTGKLHLSSQIFAATGTYSETWTIGSDNVATAIVAYANTGGDTLLGQACFWNSDDKVPFVGWRRTRTGLLIRK